MSGDLNGRNILLGVTGSIAAYKAADLCSQLGKLGANVHVVLTRNAREFVGVPTFRALTRNPVLQDVFDEPHDRRISHIDVAQTADLVVVAPATANIIGKMANGLADDMLSTCLLAVPASTPLLVAPAMNTVMWQHPATVENVARLKQRGVRIVEPGQGLLACRDVGVGKLADVQDIVQAIREALATDRDFEGVRVLVTAGATREPLDPVRFLSNRSSGKMGYALAEAAARRGADVTLVSGFATAPVPDGVNLIRVETAEQMLFACEAAFPESRITIAAAAVADYAPEVVAQQKIKKSDSSEDGLVLRLKRNPDIVAALGRRKATGQIVVGFAAETESLRANALTKLASKRLDLIVANDVTQEGAGFDSDTNIVSLFWPDGRSEDLPRLSKKDVSHRILDALAQFPR